MVAWETRRTCSKRYDRSKRTRVIFWERAQTGIVRADDPPSKFST